MLQFSFLRTYTRFLFTLISIFFLARLSMLSLLSPAIWENSYQDITYALYIGLKFDGRLAVFCSIPLAIVMLIPAFERRLDCLWPWLVGLYLAIFSFVSIVYAADIGFFFFLRERIDANALTLFDHAQIALGMIWQSYPVIWISLGVAFITLCATWGTAVLLWYHQVTPALGFWRRAGVSFVAFFFVFLIGYGQIASNLLPLRCSDAYFSPSTDLATLALNPVLNLIGTQSAPPTVNIEELRRALPRLAPFFGVPQASIDALSFDREQIGALSTQALSAQELLDSPKRNIVLIFMESLAWARTTLSWPHTSALAKPSTSTLGAATALTPTMPEQTLEQAQLNATPFLQELAGKSLLFSKYYSPTHSTARAIFSAITGIPDINYAKGETNSRKQSLLNQDVIMNAFTGYEKFYMLGGSASWANIQGIITHTVDGVRLLEEGYWQAPNIDVWGISDLELFRESAQALAKTTKPFIAFIQTAGFHRPYTIPEKNDNFIAPSITEAQADYLGFISEAEYRSLAFSDHALKRFFDFVKDEPWFANTIFLITGDHGLSTASKNVPKGYIASNLQTAHVPLIIYAPGLIAKGLIAPKTLSIQASHLDLFPTMASLAGLSVTNTSLGRPLVNYEGVQNKHPSMPSFLTLGKEGKFRVIDGNFAYGNKGIENLYKLTDPEAINLIDQYPEEAARLRQFGHDFFTLSKHLLFSNKK